MYYIIGLSLTFQETKVLKEQKMTSHCFNSFNVYRSNESSNIKMQQMRSVTRKSMP